MLYQITLSPNLDDISGISCTHRFLSYFQELKLIKKSYLKFQSHTQFRVPHHHTYRAPPWPVAGDHSPTVWKGGTVCSSSISFILPSATASGFAKVKTESRGIRGKEANISLVLNAVKNLVDHGLDVRGAICLLSPMWYICQLSKAHCRHHLGEKPPKSKCTLPLLTEVSHVFLSFCPEIHHAAAYCWGPLALQVTLLVKGKLSSIAASGRHICPALQILVAQTALTVALFICLESTLGPTSVPHSIVITQEASISFH